MSSLDNTHPSSQWSGPSFGSIYILLLINIVLLPIYFYAKETTFNPITGEAQYITMSATEEIAFGLAYKTKFLEASEGLYPDKTLQDYVDTIGETLVNNSMAKDTPWQWEFHLTNSPEEINAYALPGGQVYITIELLRELETEGQIASVLAHEMGHVLARHAAQQVATEELIEGVLDETVFSYLLNMKFSRDDELNSDTLSYNIITQAGYDPRALIKVLDVLRIHEGADNVELMSTHPTAISRIENVRNLIAAGFPLGIPEELTK